MEEYVMGETNLDENYQKAYAFIFRKYTKNIR